MRLLWLTTLLRFALWVEVKNGKLLRYLRRQVARLWDARYLVDSDTQRDA